MSDRSLLRKLGEWRQITAEILYCMPDHRSLVQSFIWQDMDRWDADPAQAFPRLRQFCAWWNATLEGPIVQVRVGDTPLVGAVELKALLPVFHLH
jgi:uncharacterized protein Usg